MNRLLTTIFGMAVFALAWYMVDPPGLFAQATAVFSIKAPSHRP